VRTLVSVVAVVTAVVLASCTSGGATGTAHAPGDVAPSAAASATPSSASTPAGPVDRDFKTTAYGTVLTKDADGFSVRVPAFLVMLRAQRSVPSASGESTLGAAISLSASSSGNLAVAPGYDLVAEGPGVHQHLAVWFTQKPASGFRRYKRYVGQEGIRVRLPVGTQKLVLTAYVGPTLVQARHGVSVTATIDQLPVVPEAGGVQIQGYSPSF
jgi:hypothetical protein